MNKSPNAGQKCKSGCRAGWPTKAKANSRKTSSVKAASIKRDERSLREANNAILLVADGVHEAAQTLTLQVPDAVLNNPAAQTASQNLE